MSTISRPRTRWLRTPLTVIGILAFAVGAVTIVVPAAARAIPIDAVVAFLGNDYILVAAFAGGALLAVLAVLAARAVTGLSQATPPDPEDIHNVALFGERFDEVIAADGVRAMVGTDRHRKLRNRLEEAAIATVMREANCPRAEAVERVERGTWTDDAEAARFLADSASGAGPTSTSASGSTSQPRRGIIGRLVASFGGESSFQRGARRTAAEIVRRDPRTNG